MIGRWRAFYGAHPLHLVAVLGCLAVAGYAALQATANPMWPRMLVWFAAAIVAHDLVLFPLYTAADRALARVHAPGRARLSEGPAAAGGPAPGRRRALNHVRVPVLGVGLTFLLFFPGIIRQGAPSYQAATGLDQQPYLGRWLLLCAAMFATSALVYLLGGLRRWLLPGARARR